MRRLPVYILIDTSGSMHGEPIESVKTGLQTLVSSLRQDPYALETAYISVISFDNTAKQIVPLTELAQFQLPEIKATGTTSMGEALTLLSQCRDKEVMKTTAAVKGDWKPLVFIMTDGEPTDDLQKGLDEFNKRKWGLIIACAVCSSNENTLKKITSNILKFETADQATFKAFFKWVSASISAGSKSVESTGKEVTGLSELPPPPAEINVVN